MTKENVVASLPYRMLVSMETVLEALAVRAERIFCGGSIVIAVVSL